MEKSKIIAELRNGADSKKFSELYVNGNIAVSGSTKDAELDLCKLIATKTDDEDLINEIFSESALYRPKIWDSNGYGYGVISTAIASMRVTPTKPSFILTDEKKEYVSASLLAEWVRDNITYRLVEDTTTHMLALYVYDNGVYKKVDERHFLGIMKQVVSDYDIKLVNMRIINEAYQQIKTDLNTIDIKRFDSDPNIINFRNGILDLRTLQLLPHSDEVLSTIQLPCNWTGVETPTPCFDNYMNTLTKNDADVIRLLLQYMGVAMSNIPGYKLKTALFLIGPGNTGKSQLKALIEHILGKGNHFAIDLKGIEQRFGTSYIYGKRLIGSADMGFMSLEELRTFKQLTGGDNIMAERKGQQAFSFTYNGVMLFCSNGIPKFRGDDGEWVYNRFCIVKCDNVIPKEQQDRDLLSKMIAESEGIVYKAVMALRDVIAAGYSLSEPQSVIDARKEYQTVNNPVALFFEECMEPSGTTPKCQCHTIIEVYRCFTVWCRSNNGGHIMSKNDFKHDLAKHLEIDEADLLEKTIRGQIIRGYDLTRDACRYY